METINDNRYFTIDETASIWKDLSPNMKAKIHQWMSRKLFLPELYNPPRTKRPCLLGIADEVAIPILHWLFFVGLRYDNSTKAPWPGDYTWKLEWGENVLGEVSSRSTRYERRPLQAFLELNQFDVVVHTWPCLEMLMPDGSISALPLVLGMPNPELPKTKMFLYHTVYLRRRADLENHLKVHKAEYADKPSTMIDAKTIYEETLKRIEQFG